MTTEMLQTLARLPYAEKLRRVAELIVFSRRFKATKQDHSLAKGMAEKSKEFVEKGAEAGAKA